MPPPHRPKTRFLLYLFLERRDGGRGLATLQDITDINIDWHSKNFAKGRTILIKKEKNVFILFTVDPFCFRNAYIYFWSPCIQNSYLEASLPSSLQISAQYVIPNTYIWMVSPVSGTRLQTSGFLLIIIKFPHFKLVILFWYCSEECETSWCTGGSVKHRHV